MIEIQAFNQAAKALTLRADTARQILEELGYGDMEIPRQSFNDDDWYEYNLASKEMVRQISCKFAKPTPRPGFAVVMGMSAKYLGLWRVK